MYKSPTELNQYELHTNLHNKGILKPITNLEIEKRYFSTMYGRKYQKPQGSS
jgi:hypothetical protein